MVRCLARVGERRRYDPADRPTVSAALDLPQKVTNLGSRAECDIGFVEKVDQDIDPLGAIPDPGGQRTAVLSGNPYGAELNGFADAQAQSILNRRNRRRIVICPQRTGSF